MNCYLTKLLFDWTVTLLNCYWTLRLLKKMLPYWTVSWLNFYWIVILFHCYLTELLPYWTVILLKRYLTELLQGIVTQSPSFIHRLQHMHWAAYTAVFAVPNAANQFRFCKCMDASVPQGPQIQPFSKSTTVKQDVAGFSAFILAPFAESVRFVSPWLDAGGPQAREKSTWKLFAAWSAFHPSRLANV